MKRVLIYLFLLLPFNLLAQQTLNLNNAIDTALKNNFDILIAKNNTEISKINNKFGVAGGLPTISATAGDNNSLYNLNQKLNTGDEIVRNNVSSNSINAGISAGIVLFNGFKVLATKEKLNSIQAQSEIEFNLQVQNVIAAVMATYYDIIRQQSYLKIIESSMDVSSKKYDIVTERNKVGMANEADLLQAQMDFNLAEQNLKSQKLIVDQTKTNLLQIIGVKQFYEITVNDTIFIDKNISKDSIFSFLDNNPEYLSAQQEIKINEQIVKELSAQRYPSLKLNTGYNYTYNSSSAGLNLLTQNYGPFVGASLLIPIFNGNIYKTQKNVALYNVKNSELQKESIFMSLKADASKAYQSYESILEQINSQEINYQNAAKLVNLVLQRFQLNQATIIDIKTAQASFENAGYMLINLQYAAKVSEIELKRLVYRLSY
jgi:outer membrane protein TolC